MTIPIPLAISLSTLVIPTSATQILATPGAVSEGILSHYFKSPVVSLSSVGDTTQLLMHKAFVTKHLSQGFPIDP